MNYLAVGEAIAERLRTGDKYRVYAARDVDMGRTQSQRAPCLFVTYGGESAIDRHGKSTLVTQTWIVLVAVANEGKNTTGEQANRTAGEMIGDVISVLQNWPPVPAINATPLSHTLSPIPHGYDDKFLYYPIAFNTTIRLTGANNEC